MTEALDLDVQALIDRHLPAFEHLEIALILAKDVMRRWTPSELQAHVQVPHPVFGVALRDLQASGLLVIDPSPDDLIQVTSSAALQSALVALSASYADERAAVVNRLSANAIGRIKTRSIQAFAEAFVLGKGNPRG